MAGATIGAAAALRLNGLLLLLPVAVNLLPWTRTVVAWRGGLRRLAAVAAAAGATLLLVQPYMLIDPDIYLSLKYPNSLWLGSAIASGNVPRIWTLFDAEQTPLLFHLGNLLFHAVGPALQIGGLAGLVFLAWRHTRPDVGSADLGSRHVVVAGKLDCQEHEVPPAPRAPSMCRHGGLDRGGSGSFYGFDQPHTTVLRRRIDATSAAQRWIADLRQDPDLVDSHILAAGRSLQLGDFEPARAHLARARVVRPGHHLAQLLACEVELRAGRPHEASKLWRAWLSRLGPPAATLCGTTN